MSDTALPRFIRLKEVLDCVPLKRSRLLELMAEGRFPRSIKLSDRAVAWDAAEITQWLSERREQSRKVAA